MLQMVKKIRYQWSYQLPARYKMPPRGWSPVLMRSLNELPEEEEEGIQWAEEEEGSQADIPEMWYTVAVSETQHPALQANSLAVEDQSWSRQRREPCCWKMQPAFSPLCFVSARITTVEEERRSEEREEDGQGERLCDERCIQVDVPLLSHKNRPMGFALHRTPLMLYSTPGDMMSISNTRVKPTHCVH